MAFQDERPSRARPRARGLVADARGPVDRWRYSRRSRRTHPRVRRDRRSRPAAVPANAPGRRPCRVPPRATSRRRPAAPPRPATIVARDVRGAQAAGSSATNLFLELKAQERHDVRGVRLGGTAPRGLSTESRGEGSCSSTKRARRPEPPASARRARPVLRGVSRSSRPPAENRAQGRPYARDPPRPTRRRAAHGGARERRPSLGGPEWRVDATLGVLLEGLRDRARTSRSTPSFSIAWWCALGRVPSPPVPRARVPLRQPTAEPRPRRRSRALEAEARRRDAGSAREALAFAKSHPDDPRAPEFLAPRGARDARGLRGRANEAPLESRVPAPSPRYPKSTVGEAHEVLVRGPGLVPAAAGAERAAVIIGVVLPRFLGVLVVPRDHRSGRRRCASRSSARSTGRRSARRGRSRSTRSGTSGWWAGSSRTAARATSRWRRRARTARSSRRSSRYWGFKAARGSSSRGGDVAVAGVPRGPEGRARRRAHARRPARPGAALQARDPHPRRAGERARPAVVLVLVAARGS